MQPEQASPNAITVSSRTKRPTAFDKRDGLTDGTSSAKVDRNTAAALLGYGDAFLFIDDVLAFERGVFISTAFYYAVDHPIVRAHLEGGPWLVPGVIITEQVCQTARLLGILSDVFGPDKHVMLGEVRGKFHAPAFAPCTLEARVRLTFQSWQAVAFDGAMMRDSAKVATVTGLACVPDPE